jgi:hypothetical protein
MMCQVRPSEDSGYLPQLVHTDEVKAAYQAHIEAQQLNNV